MSIVEFLLKEFYDNKLKFTYLNQKQIRHLKPMSNVYLMLYKACERLHSIPEHTRQYVSALDWWCFLLDERAIDSIPYDYDFFNPTKKTEVIKYLKNRNIQITKYKNPFDKYIYCNTWILFKNILKFSQQSESFRREIFTPLKRALSDYVKWCETKDCSFPILENDKWYYRKGKRKILVDNSMPVAKVIDALIKNLTPKNYTQ